MKFTLTKIGTPRVWHCFVVDIDYEHGDADHYETLTHTIPSTDQTKLAEFIAKFDELAQKIGTVRAGYCATDNTISLADDWIQIRRDLYAEGIPDYYAAMSIRKIHLYDDDGTEFLVEVER